MKKISLWASQHTWLTRFIILLIYIFLNIVGWIIGDLLTSFNIHFNSLLLGIPCLLGILGLYLYPLRKKNALYIIFYRRHKIADLLLATSTFLFIVFSGNRLELWYAGTDARANSVTYSAETIVNPGKKDPKEKKYTFKEWKKNIREAVKIIRKAYKEEKKGTRIALTTLSIVVASILIILLAALSCEIACSGAEALAIILFIVGTSGIIFGLVRIIQRINIKYKGPKPPKETPTTETGSG